MRVLAVGSVVALALAACGGGSSQKQCPVSQPCGGDVVGTWQISDACAVPAVAAQELMVGLLQPCPGLRTAVSNVQSGTVTFGADLTFTASTSAAGSITATFPASCHQDMNCAELAQNLPGVPTCAGSSECTCTIDWPRPVFPYAAGTYTTSGDVLTLDPNDALGRHYCVDGTTLHIFRTFEPDATIVDQISLAAR